MKNQTGNAILMTILVLLVLVAIGLAIGGLWRKHQRQTQMQAQSTNLTVKSSKANTTANTTTLTKSNACSGPSSAYVGKTLSSPGTTFVFCEPNGWDLGFNGGAEGSSIIADAQNIIYTETRPAVSEEIGGKDGIFAFAIYYNVETTVKPNTSDYFVSNGWTNSGAIKTGNVTGTKLIRTQKDTAAAGEVDIPAGTKQYMYYFVNGNADLSIDYNDFPNNSDEHALIEQVISTLKLN